MPECTTSTLGSSLVHKSIPGTTIVSAISNFAKLLMKENTRERERERQTDRQTERNEAQIKKSGKRPIIGRDKEKDRQSYSQTDRQSYSQTDRD